MTDQHFTSLHYTNSLGTDLTVGLPDNHIWQGGMEKTETGILFNANVPTEEIYSAPKADAVNGTVYSTRPLVYNGNTIDHFHLTFKDGKVVDAAAEIGEDVLKNSSPSMKAPAAWEKWPSSPTHRPFLCRASYSTKPYSMKMPPAI